MKTVELRLKLREGSPKEARVSSTQVHKIIQRAQSWVADGVHPALVILAARKGVIFLHEAFGRMGPEADAAPVKPDTIFPIASLTKLITAATAMMLVEEGALGLNRPVADYLPEFQGEGKDQILVRHLMTHTSGIRDEDVQGLTEEEYPGKGLLGLNYAVRDNPDRFIDIVARTPPHNPPDTLMMYADLNYQLLASVLARISGTSLDELTHERILSPLKMVDTHHILPERVRERLIRRAETAPYYEHLVSLLKGVAGYSGVISSAEDFAVFGQMMLNRGRYDDMRLLSPASVHAMTTNQIPGLGAAVNDGYFHSASWGLGWSVNDFFKGPLYGEPLLSSSAYGHGGAGGVFVWVDPALELVAVYFSVQPDERFMSSKGCADLFINMLAASVEGN